MALAYHPFLKSERTTCAAAGISMSDGSPWRVKGVCMFLYRIVKHVKVKVLLTQFSSAKLIARLLGLVLRVTWQEEKSQ